MFKLITEELKEHAPITALGALSGIIIMLLFKDIPPKTSQELFYVFHPLHILLSALATATMYRLHTCPQGKGERCNLPLLLAIGYTGAIGIATLSDSIMPYIGEILMNMPHRHHHIGFIEKFWLVNSVALVGIILAYFNPSTKFPHFGHVLISTWASVFHIMMALGQGAPLMTYIAIFLFLFFAVWLPCCISDIIFPLLFVKNGLRAHKKH